MDEIMDLAKKLGERIGADARAKAMGAARTALEKSMTDRQLLADYENAQMTLHSLESAGKPIEPDQKRKFADLHGKVIASVVIKNLLKAQADYLELMSNVSQQIEDAAMDVIEPPAGKV